MTYDPNVPLSTDLVSADLSQMQTNFSQANTIFNTDHFNYVAAPSGNRGMHRLINFPVIPTPPTLSGDASAIYPKLIGGKAELFFANATLEKQLTGPNGSLVPGSGYISIPGGLVLAWGFDATTGQGNHQKTWLSATGFTFTNVYAAWIVPISNTGTSGQFAGLNSNEPSAAGPYQYKGFDNNLLYWIGGGNGIQGVYIFGIGN